MTDTDAADYLRELAAMSRQMRSRVEDPAVTLEHAAQLLDARADSEPTQPHAIVLRICSMCGHPTPAAWTPPDG